SALRLWLQAGLPESQSRGRDETSGNGCGFLGTREAPEMTVREILKMGDPRLLRKAQPVQQFDTPELHDLIRDMFDTMHAANGAGLAAPQIGVDLQVVIFGFSRNVRYPDAPPVPETVLINPVITPLGKEMEQGWERSEERRVGDRGSVRIA